MGYAHEYADAIMHRGRVPMEPADFVPDWSDRPRKGKYYPGVESFPLPAAGPGVEPAATTAAGCLPGQAPPADRRFTLELLSEMLLDSYGLTGRRLGVQANTDLAALPHYTNANWSRGTASGGGLYPAGIHWVSGPSGPLTPGVHFYSTTQHAMQRLLAGDVSGEVRQALGEAPGAADTDQFLILTIKYWQNSFKYNSFCFHAVSMDIGAVLQTWRMWARARGLRIEPALWFDEQRLAELLGVEGDAEGVFAVIPLSWEGAAANVPTRPAQPRRSGAAVRHTDSEQSRTLLTFETLERIHAATAEAATERPAAGALAEAATEPLPGTGDPIELPPAGLPPVTVRQALRSRRSSFGRFDATEPMTAAQLASTLAASAATSLGGDGQPEGTPQLAKLYAFVNHVRGIEPGSYEYDPTTHTLRCVVPGPPGEFLQRNYFLSNYNLEQTGAVIVPTVRTTAVLDAVGDRGYRLVNGVVGAIAQVFYTTSAALGLGAGVALGFDNISFIERLGLEDSGEAPLLIMLLGNERPQPADFRYEIA
ncbi:nitroreductase family protein [Streptomyces sp. TP-A0874]|uniref:nitroreductase family protein n=1 Tax=Streptomyces sp. TP-A0874 TaxID=549819 RepID=UPI000852AD50|nr:nitroreductase family protein [Streptomyces sp. TP-A0874]